MSTSDSHKTSQRVFPCPSCKNPMRRLEGKKGPFWGCSTYPKCQATLNDLDGKPSAQVDEQYLCPKCTRRMVKADKGGYWFCSGYSKGCKVKLSDDEGRPQAAYPCPGCEGVLVKRAGKNGEFWGCREYPECTTTLRNKDDRPDFDFFTAQTS